MRLRKENILWNVLLGSGVYLLDSLRDRLSDGMSDLNNRARDTYSEASRRVGRASDAIMGEDGHGLSTAAAVLIGIGVGVGVGMLLAPASGEETRSNLSNKVQEFGDRMRDKFSEQRREPGGTGTYGA
jgi:YtxH-like protein